MPVIASTALMATPTAHIAVRQLVSTSIVTATETQTVAPIQTANVFLYALTTTVAIQQTPSADPTPTYIALADGSLVTADFVNDFVADKARLVVLGLLLMLFSRNVAASISYLFRVKLKSKLLFYFLLPSQICGVLAMLSLLSPFFIQNVSCHFVNIFAATMAQISYTFLIPGILAVKAFRCLERNRFIMVVVILLHTTSVVLFVSALPNLVSQNSVTGTCSAHGDLRRIVIAILVLLLEIIFICGCFMYAVWRAPEARGRVSIRMSMQRVLSTAVDPVLSNEEKRDNTKSRGWWDYVKESHGGEGDSQLSRTRSQSSRSIDSELRPSGLYGLFLRLFSRHEPYLHRKPSVHSVQPLKQGMTKKDKRMSWRHWSRMLKFPSALKTELGYTCVIAVTCALAAGLIVAGAFDYRLFGGPTLWAGLSWGLTSLLVMRNFSRLVRRNEREETLKEPAAWNPLFQSSNDQPPPHLRRNMPVSTISSTSSIILGPSSRQRATDRPENNAENPFADFEPVRNNNYAESWRPPTAFAQQLGGTMRSALSRGPDGGPNVPEDVHEQSRFSP